MNGTKRNLSIGLLAATFLIACDLKGPVDLAGEYEFYWHRLLTPGDFATASPPQPSGFMRGPRYWNGFRLDRQELPGDGYATYRLTILLGKSRPPLAIKIMEVSTAYRLFIDQNEAASVGVAGESMETTVPRQYPVLLVFTPVSDRVVLLIQVSNFHHRRGGLWELITLGKEKALAKLQERKRDMDFFLLGGVFIMAVYHFWWRRSTRLRRASCPFRRDWLKSCWMNSHSAAGPRSRMRRI